MLDIELYHFLLIYHQEGHEEAQEEFPKKAKFFFSAAVQNWDADFYVKVDDNIDLDLGKDLHLMCLLGRSCSHLIICFCSLELIEF